MTTVRRMSEFYTASMQEQLVSQYKTYDSKNEENFSTAAEAIDVASLNIRIS